MNIKRFIIAVIAVFVTFQVLDFIIHGQILSQEYRSLSQVWRPDMMSKMWIMVITSLIMSILFVYVFIKGYEKKGILEGLRYGLIIGLFMIGVGSFNQYVVYPVPFSLAVKWFIFGMIEFTVAGIIVSAIYKPKE